MMDEKESLRGNVIFHPSFVTPHDYPVFLRSAVCRVVAGSMLLSGIFTGLCAVVTQDGHSRAGCALSTGVSLVAFYHYGKLVATREQSGSRVTLSKPGDVPMGQATALKIGWIDMVADAVRYSDWLITLPILVVELHLLIDHGAANAIDPVWFSIPWAVLLTCAMIVLGAYTRFGTDELVPIRKDQRNSLLDGFARLSGVLAFVGASACLFFVLYNLLGNVSEDNDPTNGWIYAFSMPWIAYGVVSLVAMFVRQFYPEGYPESLSVFKDVSYGVLDIWSKAVFGAWIGAKSLGITDPMFSF
jgi:bacteriorhodopsin